MVVINDIVPANSPYVGLFYAYEASGGFIMEKGVGTTIIIPSNSLNRYDMTNALQIKYDVRKFNQKLGLFKDASNINILSTSYSSDKFPDDEITLSAAEFSLAVGASDIISVGRYSTLYSDFGSLLNAYFGYPPGFTSLFTLKTPKTANDINGGIFDASAMDSLMNYSVLNASGEYVNTMTGSITINSINSLLRYACKYNTFNNRTTQTIENGFIENDLIYIPTGTTVTLVATIVNTDTSNNNLMPTTAELNTVIQISPGKDFSNNYYSQQTTYTYSSITRVVKVPLLIVLKNLS